MAKSSEPNRGNSNPTRPENATSSRGESSVVPGPQDHAEGQHGATARRRIVEQLQSRPHDETLPGETEQAPSRATRRGKSRLDADRQQHDEAEKNSERARLDEERGRGRTT